MRVEPVDDVPNHFGAVGLVGHFVSSAGIQLNGYIAEVD